MTITAIMIDTREPEWVQKLTFGGIPTIVTMLPEGDVMAATATDEIILIERKTPDDFLNTLRDERLFPQLANMLDRTRWAYLMITGELQRGANGNIITDRGQTGWNWAAVQGALLTIQEMGIFVTYAAGDTDYENSVLRIGNRDRKLDLLLAPAKFPRILSAQEALVAALPGIGTERLQIVMDFCGSAAWAICALSDKDSQIKGIPANVKVKVRAALGLKDDEQLGIVTGDGVDVNAEFLQVMKLGAQ
jgi:ERCC4-type nuclease